MAGELFMYMKDQEAEYKALFLRYCYELLERLSSVESISLLID